MTGSPRELYVFIEGRLAGYAARQRRGPVHFEYSPARSSSAVPLSMSLPIGGRERTDISAWLDGLLPENPQTRSRWAHELGARSVEPFDLLCTEAGLECAGAVQFCTEPVLPASGANVLQSLSEAEVAEQLRLISEDGLDAASHDLGSLRLSLPGAQPKMALRRGSDGWQLPSGTLATTHILKPQHGHLNPAVRDSIAVNEHLCQRAAAILELGAARTALEVFEDVECLVVERFDRQAEGDEVRRTHAEDLCQALGLAPRLKYQADGGPGAEAVIELLRREAAQADTRRFFLSVFFNWLIGNPDGHSKNYSLLLGGTRCSLAPLYDLSSAAPYASAQGGEVSPAMWFEGTRPVELRDWSRTAGALGAEVTVQALRDFRDALPEAFRQAVDACPDWASEKAQRVGDAIVAYAKRHS